MTQNNKCLMRYTKTYVTQEISAEYLLNKINMYTMLIPQNIRKQNATLLYPSKSS